MDVLDNTFMYVDTFDTFLTTELLKSTKCDKCLYL